MRFNEWFTEQEHGHHPTDWAGINPDSAMRSYGDAGKFTAFVWVFDRKSNKSLLYCQPGNQYHGVGMSSYDKEGQTKLIKAKIFQNRDAVVCFGRFGMTKGGGFVTIWNYDQEHSLTDYDQEYKRDMNRGYNPPSKQDIKVLLNGLLGQASIKVIGESPAQLPITPDYRFVVKGEVTTVGEFVGGGQKQQENPQDAKCRDMIKVNVQNRPTALADVQAQLHMVKGAQRDLLRGAFCSQYQSLKNQAHSQGCAAQQRQLDDIEAGFQCGDDRALYGSLKQQGKDAYKQQLRDIFRDPSKLSQYFRTQKELDAAWDYLQKSEHSFQGWLNRKLVQE